MVLACNHFKRSHNVTLREMAIASSLPVLRFYQTSIYLLTEITMTIKSTARSGRQSQLSSCILHRTTRYIFSLIQIYCFHPCQLIWQKYVADCQNSFRVEKLIFRKVTRCPRFDSGLHLAVDFAKSA